MARFVFQLQTLLKARRAQEEAAQRSVAEAQRRRVAVQDAIRARQGALNEARAAIKDCLGGGETVDLAQVRSMMQASAAADAQARTLAVQLAGEMQRLGKTQEELRIARGKRRAVEVLRDARYDQWRREQARREAAETDDIVNAAVVRRAAEERA